MRLRGRLSTRTRRSGRRSGAAGLALLGLAAAMVPPLLTVTQQSANAAVLPEGFVEEIVLSGLSSPTTIQFAPDGRVFVAEQGGLVKSFPSLAGGTATVVADLRPQVHRFWDRGLLGMALDPDFANTQDVYVLYTYDDDPNTTATTFPAWGDTCPNPPGATADGCVVMGRLSRLDLTSGTAVETVLVEDWCQQYPSHSIGQLVFGADGALYASAGDGASFNFADFGQDGNPVNPCGDPPGGVGSVLTAPTAEGGALRSQDLRTAGDPVGLDGTVIRIDKTTGAGLPDNPLASSSDRNARRIIASGLRNPFRFDQRPGTRELWIGDVGWGSFEEINRITDPTSAAGPTNFGWPCYEGPSRQSSYDGLNLNICEQLYALEDNGTPATTRPHFAYRHGQQVAGETCTTGSSSTSGIAFQFYEGGSYPSQYQGALFFADYARNCIWVMEKGADGVPAPGLVRPFAQGAAGPVDLKIGPGGDLYYADLSGGTIRRIRYTGTTPPPAPADCTDSAQLTGVDVGSPGVPGSTTSSNGQWTVTGGGADIWGTADQFHFACRPLSGDGSTIARVASQTNTDPWAKAGVMMRASTAADAAHAMVVVTPSNGVAFQYRTSTGGVSTHVAGPLAAAPRWVRLTRSGTTLTGATSSDGSTWTTIGSTSAVALGSAPRTGLAVTSHNNATTSTAVFEQVTVPGDTTAPPTNSPPVPSISTPSSSLTWAVGNSISFSGSATDAEDGTVASAGLTWDVLLQHCGRTNPEDCHAHTVQSFAGTSSGSFTAPDHDWPSYLELRLTAEDSAGATGTTTVALQPKTVDLSFATSPSGLSLVVGGDTPTTPHTRTFIVGAGTAIGATSPQTLDGTTYTFSSWAHGGAANQTLTVPATATTYTATYAAAGISLTATAYKVKGVQHADLRWTGATTSQVEIYRNGTLVATTPDDGVHADNINRKGGGTYGYQVCEPQRAVCSAVVQISF